MFAAGERVLVFTHFAEWGHEARGRTSPSVTGTPVECYHGGLSRTVRDRMIHDFQTGDGCRARSCCRSRPAAPG